MIPELDAAAFGSMTDSLSRQLERELAAYKAEVELAASKAEVEFWKAKAYEAEFYEGINESEVERLRANLQRAIEIAYALRSDVRLLSGYSVSASAVDELDQLKATLNPTNK